MLSRQFLSWAQMAPAGARAEAGQALACAFLYADLHPTEQGDMERALTTFLDDPSPLVRRALAEALAGAVHAPHHLIAALAADQPDIAVIVLGRSPILSDGELIDAAAVGGPQAQRAIAARPVVSTAVAGALAEIGARDAVLALCQNDGASLADVSIRRIIARFGFDGGIREALLWRLDLDAVLQHELVVATGEALRRFVTGCGWVAPERIRRVVDETSDRAVLALARQEAEDGDDDAHLRFAAYLRSNGRLTPALILRVLMSGEVGLFEAMLSELSGQPLGRVAGLVRRHDGLGFAALIRAAGLSGPLLPAIRAALDMPDAPRDTAPATLRRQTVAQVLDRCRLGGGSTVAGLTALLRRFESEAIRDETRAVAQNVPPPSPAEHAVPAVGRRPSPPLRIEPRFNAAPDFAVAA